MNNKSDNNWMKALATTFVAVVAATIAKKAYDNRDEIKNNIQDLVGRRFMVFGAPEVGKTALLNLIQSGALVHNAEPYSKTQPGGTPFPRKKIEIGHTFYMSETIDVPGDGMKLSDIAQLDKGWEELFDQVNPEGVIFMIDHIVDLDNDNLENAISNHQIALRLITDLITNSPKRRQTLKVFWLLFNKKDIWQDHITPLELSHLYEDEMNKLRIAGMRFNFAFHHSFVSLVTGEGVNESLLAFFQDITSAD